MLSFIPVCFNVQIIMMFLTNGNVRLYRTHVCHTCHLIRIGMAVAALFENYWYRAQILSLQPGKVTLFYVDYGNQAMVNAEDIRVLPREYQQLPAQAIRFSLYGITMDPKSWADEVRLLCLLTIDN